jgi:hypothetical protein
MVRISKQGERRGRCPHRPRVPGLKTGKKKDNLSEGFKLQVNFVKDISLAKKTFIDKNIG